MEWLLIVAYAYIALYLVLMPMLWRAARGRCESEVERERLREIGRWMDRLAREGADMIRAEQHDRDLDRMEREPWT